MRFAQKIVFSIAFSVILLKTKAQQPELVLNRFASQNPIEKIYLHLDREDYMAGQTIWFKSYLYSDFLPDIKSTDLFVELIDTASSTISRVALPIFAGFSHGQITIPDSLPAGTYLLKAYTPTMLNHDPAFIYSRNIYVLGKKLKPRGQLNSQPLLHIDFFPEGGNLIAGLSNSVAFKIANQNGLPVNLSGVVRNNKDEAVASFSSYHDGMGYFDLTVDPTGTYYAVINDDPSQKKYYLPSPTTRGVVFRVISNGPTKSFEILQRNDDPVFKAAYMIGQMQHHVVFKRTFRETNDDLTGIIPIDKLSSGILHLTVFNSAGLPLAERLTFVDNREYLLHGDLLIDTLNFSDRGKNHFTLALNDPDTIEGSFSISICDPSFDLVEQRTENIFSGLLLTSDLKGYINNPAYYFSSGSDSVLNALDLVMMTNGWRRFRWNALLHDSLLATKYSDPGFIRLAGTINSEGTKKPFADKDLLLFIISANSGRNMQLLHTDKLGHFTVDSAVFFGMARVLLTDIRGKKSRYIDVKLDADSLHHSYVLPHITHPGYTLEGVASAERIKKLVDEYDEVMKAEGLMLQGVTVKARKKTPLEETEEKYVSDLFAGKANSTLDVTNENMMGYRDIFDYLKMRVPGLQVLTDPEGPGYIVEYRQTASASAMGEFPMTIFLNEIPSDADAIASIPPYEIALVKVYSNFVGAWGNAPGGVLAIYTKKDADLRAALPTSGKTITYGGYSIVKEFYSPDYIITKKTDKPDQRMTLYWNPSIVCNALNPKIPIVFFNSDRARQFRVVVEGMTAEGKLVLIEKTIRAKAF